MTAARTLARRYWNVMRTKRWDCGRVVPLVLSSSEAAPSCALTHRKIVHTTKKIWVRAAAAFRQRARVIVGLRSRPPVHFPHW